MYPLPLLSLPSPPLTAQGLFMYWLTASTFSIGQILLLKFPQARAAFGIPKLVHHPPPQPQQLGEKKQGEGFFSTLKQSKP